jgi:hypothetical protein
VNIPYYKIKMIRTIQGFSNYEMTNNGEVYNKNTAKLLKDRKSANGMTMVLLTDDNGTRKWMEVSDLLYRTFDDDEIQGKYDDPNYNPYDDPDSEYYDHRYYDSDDE